MRGKKSWKMVIPAGLIAVVILSVFLWIFRGGRNDFGQTEVVTAETLNSFGHPLIAMAEETGRFDETSGIVRGGYVGDSEIKLFAQNPDEESGVILQIGRERHEFDWLWKNGGLQLPLLFLGDPDLDGEEEIICISENGSGTGISLQKLRVAEFTQDGRCQVYADNSDFIHLGKVMSVELSEDGRTVELDVDGKTAEIDLDELEAGGVFDDLVYGDWLHYFYVEDRIIVQMNVGIVFKGEIMPYYTDLVIRADVVYRDGEFSLSGVECVEEGEWWVVWPQALTPAPYSGTDDRRPAGEAA